MKKIIAIAFVVLVVGACKSSEEKVSQPNQDPSWNGSMKGLQSSLQKLAPYIFNEEEFADKKNEEMLSSQIREMAMNTKAINHNPTLVHRDPSVRFIANQFAEDLDRAAESFLEGKKSFSRYQLMKVGSYCVECHTSDQGGVEKSKFKAAPFFQGLKPINKAEYLIANRDFESAYDVLMENLSEAKNLDNLASDRQIRLLLMIAVRYKDSYPMTEKVIKLLRNSKNLPPFLKISLAQWESSMLAWKLQKKSPADLKAAQAIFAKAKSDIDYMRTLNILHNLFKQGIDGDNESEALYIAGKCYEHLNDISPMELHENYYKACIYNKPGSDAAKKCYRTLEDSVITSYTGSSGVHVPVEVDVWLKELKKKAENK